MNETNTHHASWHRATEAAKLCLGSSAGSAPENRLGPFRATACVLAEQHVAGLSHQGEQDTDGLTPCQPHFPAIRGVTKTIDIGFRAVWQLSGQSTEVALFLQSVKRIKDAG